MKKSEMLVDYLSRFIGRPYIWGGDGTGACLGGFDCSGLVLEGLWAMGLYGGPDVSSEGLRQWCSSHFEKSTGGFAAGDVLFFGKGGATHCAVAVNESLMIEAGGGTSSCVNSSTSTGFVRVRPISRRKDLLISYRPNL